LKRHVVAHSSIYIPFDHLNLHVLQKLSECLPLSRAGLRSKRMVVLLKDALERLWPVLCLEQTSLTSGWSDFRKANNIKSGDACDFRVEDKSKCIVAVDIHHK